MIAPMWRGDDELERRASDLGGRLPEALAPLARIAYNYRWCWTPGGNLTTIAVLSGADLQGRMFATSTATPGRADTVTTEPRG